MAFQLFIPLILEGMPQKVGYLKGAPGSPCVENRACVLFTLGAMEVLSTSFAYYIIAVSVLCQALVFISVGAMADYGGYRKRMLIVSTIVGSASAILMLTVVTPRLYWYAAILSIVMNMAFGTATVFYNAYLPLLANNYSSFEQEAAVGPDAVLAASDTAGLAVADDEKSVQSSVRLAKLDNASSYISTRGFIIGYLAAIIVLAMCALFLFLAGNAFFNLQICVAFCGVWWLGFAVLPLVHLKRRPGPRLPAGTNYMTFSWRKVINTLGKCRRLPVTFWYLLCFFFFSDGYSTQGQVAVIFARTEMNVPYEKLIIAVLISPVASVAGNYFFYYLQRWARLSSKAILIIQLGLMGLIPVYGTMGIFTTKIGMHNQWEIYAFSTVYGFLIGSVQSYSRVIFSELIPPGDESEFFSLYAITDKGSSWLGPLVQSLMYNLTGNSRFGMVVLVLMIWAPIPVIVCLVDMSRGIRDAQAFHAGSQEEIADVGSQEKLMAEVTRADEHTEEKGHAALDR